ncbi:hypothetical protein FB446DRAFT_716042 [Lentinula raphanica]|nr:hypothetical protein FB446DRAFT_716042 [Lentinula raphanica]
MHDVKVIGLLATGCDYALTRRKEKNYAWNREKPLRITFVKILFVLARYLAFVIHIVNIVLSSIWTVKFQGCSQLPDEACRKLLVFQIISSYSMLLILQMILMLRVFALYNRSTSMGLFLFSIFVCRLAVSAYTSFGESAHSPRNLKFGKYCIPRISLTEQSVGNSTLVFIYGELIIQVIIHGLSWKRTMWDLRHYSNSYSRPPLLSVLDKDSLRVFMGISVAMTAVGLSTVKITLPVAFVFPLFISLISALGCRAILNLQTLVDASLEIGRPSIQNKAELTTVHGSNMTSWDAPWELATFQNDSDLHRDIAQSRETTEREEIT